MPCPADDQLRQFLNDTLDRAERSAIVQHVSICPSCQTKLDALTSTDLPQVFASRTTTSREEPADALLQSLVSRLRDRPPATWISEPAAASMSDSIQFTEPKNAEAPLGWLGPYQIQRELGSGVTGQVFVARDSRLGRLVAIKVLRPQLASHAAARSRFEREAWAAAALEDERIVKIFEVGSEPGFPPFTVMEFVAGESLATRIERERVLNLRAAAEIVRQVAIGLQSAHQSGIVHRDVKPANVLLDAVGDRAKITDFGLARVSEATEQLTQEGVIAGTPAYMSPEQIRRPQGADARSDVYSLGVMLYEMLTGERPFRGVMRMILFQALNEEPVPPRRLNDRIPRDLETICLKAMSKEPALRYATAGELADDLRRWIDGLPVQARPIGLLGRVWRWSRRNPKLAAANAIVAAILLAGAFDFARYARPIDQLRRDIKLSHDEMDRLRRLADRRQTQVERLAQALVFDAHDAISDSPDAWQQRKKLLQATLESLKDSGVAAAAEPSESSDSLKHTAAVAHNRLGDLFRDHGELAAAEEQFRVAVALLNLRQPRISTTSTATSSVGSDSTRLLLAESLTNLAGVLQSVGNFSEATDWLRQALDQTKSLAANLVAPTQLSLLVGVLQVQARAAELLGVCESSLGKSDQISDARRLRLTTLKQLLQLDSDNPRWSEEVAELHLRAGEEALHNQQLAQATVQVDEAIRLFDHTAALSKMDPHHGLEWVRSVANQRLRVAELLSRLQRPDDSLHLARQSFEAFRELASESAPPALIRDAIVSASRLANDLTNRKDFVSAQPVWQQATDWSDRLLAEVATEFSDRQTMTLVQRNLLLVEMKLGWANKASERLNRLRQMLSSLATDATTHDRPEQREWVTTQLQELTMLNINP